MHDGIIVFFRKPLIGVSVHEGAMARMERVNKRQFIIILVLIAVIIASFVGFFVYESQYEDVRITQDWAQTADGDGNNSYNGEIVGGDYYGKPESQNNN